jgi:hypothetical protein
MCQRARYVDVVSLLLRHGADANGLGGMALVDASEFGHVDVVSLLVASGADVRAKKDRALCVASMYGHVDVVTALLRHGADPFNAEAMREARSRRRRYGDGGAVRVLTDWRRNERLAAWSAWYPRWWSPCFSGVFRGSRGHEKSSR